MTEYGNSHEKSINSLIKKAKSGLLIAQLQLHDYYDKGKYVNQDPSLAKMYLESLENSLQNKKIKLNTLSFWEFRRFKKISIDFDSKITVIIGENGAGKTSIADALAKLFSWFNNNLERDYVGGSFLSDNDINIDNPTYAEVIGNFELDKKNFFEPSLSRASKGFPAKHLNDVNIAKQFGAMYRKTAKNSKVIIPLLAFYSVERSSVSFPQKIQEKASEELSSNRFVALKDALNGSGKLENFSELYIELANIAEGETTKDAADIRTQISTLEKLIIESPKEKVLTDMLETKKNDLKKINAKSTSTNHQRHLSIINRAIELLVPGVKNLRIDRDSGKTQLMVQNFDREVNITQLSQGQKMATALVGDLARRLVTLNPDSENPLLNHGVVIIDEIELHLHPKWQQGILLGLQETFPNIQFVVTTHSPQVLSTVDKSCIRQIITDNDGNPTVITPSFQTKGVTSADILNRIMDTNPYPSNIEESGWVDEFHRCLIGDNREGAVFYLEKIEQHFMKDHPVTIGCTTQLNIYDTKKRIAQKKEAQNRLEP